MRQIAALVFLFLSACANTATEPDFSWPKDHDAIPNEHTAIMISLAIFQGQIKRNIGDPNEIATHLQAFRYRLSDLVHDPKGDAWFVEPSDKEAADFGRNCANRCIGGDLYTMALSVHDGRILEFYLPQ